MEEVSGRRGKDLKFIYYKCWLRPDFSKGQSIGLAFGVPWLKGKKKTSEIKLLTGPPTFSHAQLGLSLCYHLETGGALGRCLGN